VHITSAYAAVIAPLIQQQLTTDALL
jgi:hypothetical protein